MRYLRLTWAAVLSCAFAPACSGSGTSDSSADGGTSAIAGAANGGVSNGGIGGSLTSSGGRANAGSANGGTDNGGATAGGAKADGGSASGAGNTNGGRSSGGASDGGKANGGSSNAGSANGGKANGGSSSAGSANGGKANGGSFSAGAANGGKANGGTSNGGAANGGTANGGTGGATSTCKRGIAANTAPGAAFSNKIAWWYNWAMSGTGAGAGIEFVPMAWGSGSVNTALPSGAKFLLGFNEPNFHAQANLTPQQAANLWPMLESKAKATGIPLVSPAMNFCGPAAECNGTDPYQYLKDFFAACASCKVDYVAVHWYNCDLPSLKDYLEPGGNLAGFEQFNRPIWLTEFSCDGNATAAQQEAYMRAAIPYLEQSTHVFRYSWFSADPIPKAKLMNSDGSPTALGQVYMDLPQSCR